MSARAKGLRRTIVIACLATAAVPAAASAATVSVSGTTLVVAAGTHEPNDVLVQRVSTVFRVTEANATLTAGAGCTSVTSQQANCPVGTIDLVRITLRDRDDAARVVGGTDVEANGGAGTDSITGGDGEDTLDSGTGDHDRLAGGGGNDTLTAIAGGGVQVLEGGPGNDVVTAGSAPTESGFFGFFTRVSGGPGTDTLNGSSNNEIFLGGEGNDTIIGGSGGLSGFGTDSIDIARYDDHTEDVTVTTADASANDGGPSDGAPGARDRLLEVEGVVGGTGNDTITGTANRDMLMGGLGGDTLNGAQSNDTICGDGSIILFADAMSMIASCSTSAAPATTNDVINGGDGADLITGDRGADTLDGGPGVDTASWSEKSSRVVVTLGSGLDGQVDTDPALAGNQPEGDVVGTDVENAVGGNGNDSLTGNGQRNHLLGGPGEDSLNGLAGDDQLCGDSTTFWSFVQAGFGLGCGANPFLSPGTPVDDVLNGGEDEDRLAGHGGADTFNGGPSVDTASYAEKDTPVTATINGTATSGEIDTDPLTGGNQPEQDRIGTDIENLVGGTSNDTLNGSPGRNALSGGFGTDVLNGFANNDVLDPGNGTGDTVNGGTGFDYGGYSGFAASSGVTISLNGVADDGPAFAGEGDNFAADVEGALGGPGPDTLTGPATVTANTLVGYGGGDILDGKAGDDSLTGGAGTDALTGDAGNDLLSMVDGEADNGNCGAGAGDRAHYDAGMDSTVSCETALAATASLAGPAVADPGSDAFKTLERAFRGL